MKFINYSLFFSFLQRRMLFFLAVILFNLGCNKNESGNEQKNGSDQKIITQVQSIEVFSGRNRVKLNLILSDPENGWARIFWDDGKDSVQVVVKEQEGKDTIPVVIENLDEGIYDFIVYLNDSEGNSSVGTKVFGTVYGDSYEASLLNRGTDDIEVNDGIIIINWEEAGLDILGTELMYDDALEISHSQIVLPNEETTEVAAYFIGSHTLKYRSFYLPKKEAIDTFYTAFQSITLVEPKLLWDGDAANGNSVMKLTNIDGDGTISVVDDPIYGSIFEYYKPVSCHRCEHHGVNGFQAQEEDDIYIGWRFKINIEKEVTTNAIFQWKAYGDNMLQNYPIVLKTKEGMLKLEQYNPGDNGTKELANVWSVPLVVDEWHTIVLRIKVSREKEKGFIEFWYNGTKQVLHTGTTRFYCRTLDAEYCDPKWGVYGADDFEVTLWVNALHIANSYDLVAPEKE